MESPGWEESWRICGVSMAYFTGKIDCLHLPVYDFIQVTEGTTTDPWRDLEQTGERDCGGLRKILCGG